MLEAVIGGIIGALVGAAGSYVVQRKLEAKRREEETLEWMLSKLSEFHSEMFELHYMRSVAAEDASDKTMEIQRLAESIKGRIHEIYDKKLRKEIYQMFEAHYEDREKMLDAIAKVKITLHQMIREDLIDVREMLHGEPAPNAFVEQMRARRNGDWQMPPKYGWRSRVMKMLKQEKAEGEQQQSAPSPGSGS